MQAVSWFIIIFLYMKSDASYTEFLMAQMQAYTTGLFCPGFRWEEVSETTVPMSFAAIFFSFGAKSLNFS